MAIQWLKIRNKPHPHFLSFSNVRLLHTEVAKTPVCGMGTGFKNVGLQDLVLLLLGGLLQVNGGFSRCSYIDWVYLIRFFNKYLKLLLTFDDILLIKMVLINMFLFL